MPSKTKTVGKKNAGEMRKKKQARSKRQVAPSSAQPKAARPKRKSSLHVLCPSYNAISAFKYPIAYKTTISVPATSTVIGVLAPYNDCLGIYYKQNVSPPDATTAVAQTTIIDPYLTSLFTPPSSSGATNALAARFVSFCAEFMVTDALAGINNTVSFLRWQQSGIPVTSSGAPADFQGMWLALGENPGLIEVPSAQLARTHCIHSGMVDRSALEFTPITIGSTAWANVYANTAGSTSTGSYNAPYKPVVFAVSNATGSNTVTLRVLIRGEAEVSPPPASFLTRISKPLPTGGADAEAKWWRYQSALNSSPIKMSSGLPSRRISGYIGEDVSLDDSIPIDYYITSLAKAYDYNHPYVVGKTLFIPGTRSASDVLSDLAIPFGMLSITPAYQDALAELLRSDVDTIVGHSLGAAVAAELGRKYNVFDVGFGSPVKNTINFADPRDPVGVFVHSQGLSNTQPFLHHGIGGY